MVGAVTTTIQLSFLPDNDVEPTVRRTSQPLVKWIDGHWRWKQIDGDEYELAPELEAMLLAAQSEQKKAA